MPGEKLLPGASGLVAARSGHHVSTRRELDDYEWAWTGSLSRWALDHPDHPDHAQALQAATTHRTEWLQVYRASFGHLCLVLRRTVD